MTIDELLYSRAFGNNQTLLAETLGINRGTFRKYMKDIEGKHHFILVKNGNYHFYANLSDRIP